MLTRTAVNIGKALVSRYRPVASSTTGWFDKGIRLGFVFFVEIAITPSIIRRTDDVRITRAYFLCKEC